MVEFAVSIIAFMTVMAVLIQLALFFFFYATLMHTTRTVARQQVVNIGLASNKTDFEARTAKRAKEYLRNAFGLDWPLSDFTASVVSLGNGRCGVRLIASHPVSAFFTTLVPVTLNARAQSEALIEDACYVWGC